MKKLFLFLIVLGLFSSSLWCKKSPSSAEGAGGGTDLGNANVVGKLGIKPAVSPREVVVRQVLGLLNSGAVISRMPLSKGEGIGILEIEVVEGAPATERVLAKLNLPPQCLIAAVIHESYVTVPGADDRLYPGDTVIALVDDSVVEEMLRIFSTNGT